MNSLSDLEHRSRALKPYPACKDSGADCLGEVPAHWQVRRLKDWLGVNELVLPEGTDPEYTFDYVDIGSIETGRLAAAPERIRFGNAPSRARRVVRSGDTIVSTVRTYLKAVWHAEHPGADLIASTGFAVLTPRRGTFPKFVSYLCQSAPFTDRVTAESVGIAYPAISETNLRSFKVCVPPLAEQAAIVRFLDHVDRRIRRYVRAKQKLIVALEEQKQAVIQQAVTGRIDVRTGRLYSAYKNSGVEHLREVPAHWDVRRLRTVAELRVSNVDKHVKNGERPVRLCNYVDVYKNDHIRPGIGFMRATATPGEIERFRLQCGDVLITKDSESWNDIGVPALVESTEDDIVCGYHLALLRPLSDYVDGGYLFRALQSSGVAHQLQIEANGVTRFGLTHGGIKSIWLPLPSLAEQAAIVRFLDHGDRRIRRYVRAMRNLVGVAASRTERTSFIDEYRTRLIADVVTGKLDVREAAAGLPDVDSAAVGDDVDDGDPAEAPGVSNPERAAAGTEHDAAAEVIPDERNQPAKREERA